MSPAAPRSCSGSRKVLSTSLIKASRVLVERRLTVHVTCTEVELSTTGLCMVTTTSPSSFCTRRWSTPWAVGLMSGEQRQKCSAVSEEKKQQAKRTKQLRKNRKSLMLLLLLQLLGIQHNSFAVYLECAQAQTWGWGPRALEH